MAFAARTKPGRNTTMRRLLFYAFGTMVLAVTIMTRPRGAGAGPTGEKRDDAKTPPAVKSKLAADRVKNLVDVSVETNDGTVRLTGKVPTAEDKFEAERVARRTTGVRE